MATPQPPKVGDDRKKAVKIIETNWVATDESPVADRENSRNASVPGRRQEEGRGLGQGGRQGNHHCRRWHRR
ncbi:hypothetical protein IMZ48_11445 [Candidatus Bathyarchaeota archaeon]|nr:hypothetical protein [Candidatus Bathyarchaeota archaeon]